MDKSIFEFIEEHREEYIEWLCKFCEIPSVAAQNRGMVESRDFLESLFAQALQTKPEILPTRGQPVVYAHLAGKKTTTLSFYNHYDVQPEDPIELWDSPPFEPTIKNGKIYARGVADNKGNIIARIAAIHAIKQVMGELPIDIKFIFEGEEEIGSIHLADFANHHQDKIQSDGCVWEFGYRDADDRLQVSLGVKGMLYVELFINGANTDLHSAQASIIESPIWRLVWALNLLKDKNDHVLIPGFYESIQPVTSEEEILLSRYILEENSTLEHLGLKQFINGLSGEKLKSKYLYEPTCNICGIQSGYTGEGSKTILPSSAFAKIDFRLVPGQKPDQLLKDLRTYLNVNGYEDIGIRVFGAEEAARTNPSEKIAEAVIETISTYSELPPNIVPNTPGTGPMYDLCQRYGIPSVSFGVGHFASYTHAPNENIRIEDFIENIKLIAALVFKFEEKMNEEGGVTSEAI
ncbi:M20/M25/M40 family metallo-hydrolase [Psychrobacillus lasiicapitis]|uniref:M20/M25/M40 family metallo-hydrolase n=1 Tax=Psychrobacillus lasiicapitis TaxID=1636719 RepID=A0A544T706_9BACI|nr:M20/M25/M40 family metallo-hydrolase [Psychrobacillus lasiicapitis]TQR13232.1 M20/M25/M40 family metallo-hydrolase [Psychrobacillus lasiicapitis]GGA33353.1 peptidase M20 [Psychrobacillus lasiicapitis]